MNEYKFHIGDYRRDAGHLTVEEHGIYRYLIDELFLQETPLSPDIHLLGRKMRLTSDQKVTLGMILSEFFTLTDDGYVHDRVSRELSRIYDVSATAKANVEKRWNKHRRNTPVIPAYNGGNTGDILPINPVTHKPTNPPKHTAQKRSVKGARFEEWYSKYPVKKGKQKAKQYWIRDNLDEMADALIADIEIRIVKDDQWRRGYIPYPQKYLNEKLWQDEYSVDRTSTRTIEQTTARSADKAERIRKITQGEITDD